MSGVQFWPIIILANVDNACEFGRMVSGTDGPDQPCTDVATGHGDLCGVDESGKAVEIHLHLCARHYDLLHTGRSEVWVVSEDD
jgi:hypothetical protein